ncbi:MAG: hypothetical protein ACE5NW_16275 [Acidiferrobacterales bacterium]
MKYKTIVAGVIGVTRHMRLLRVFLVAVVALVLGAAIPEGWAHDDDGDEIPFDEAELFFELNNTDGDLGIHALIDGEGWKKLEIEDPNERRMLLVWVAGRLRRQGLTEIFFESAEPTFDELAPADFFARFPEGEYEIEGRTLDGVELESIAELTHTMPAPAGGITLNGVSDAPIMKERCDDESDLFGPTAVTLVDDTVTIAWAEVMTSHPDLGSPRSGDIVIHNYEVVVEVDVELDGGEEFTSVLHVVLPPGELSVTVPPEFIAQGEEFKYEILAREESFNQTAVESCFVLE